MKTPITLYQSIIKSPIGDILIITDDTHLLLIEFTGTPHFDKSLNRLQKRYHYHLSNEENPIQALTKNELNAYFKGDLKHFSIPFKLIGTEFQNKTWESLLTIPYGETISYKEEAILIHKPSAIRAVANANGANLISIVIPCHRVIGHDQSLTGYGSGIERKKWLLAHEKKFCK